MSNGMQRVVTPDGWIIPLHVRNGLAYMDMHPPTQDEYETYDNVVLISDVTWDPTVFDNETDLSVPNDNLIVDIEEEYYDARSSDIGEKGTQRNIAEMLYHHERDTSSSLNVLDHEDTLDFLASETYFDADGARLRKGAGLFRLCPYRSYKEDVCKDDAVCSQHRLPSISYPPEITLSSIECAA